MFLVSVDSPKNPESIEQTEKHLLCFQSALNTSTFVTSGQSEPAFLQRKGMDSKWGVA